MQKKYFLLSLLLLTQLHTHASKKNTVIATLNAGVNPAGIAITPNDRYAYVANNNSYDVLGEDSISVFNLKNNTLKQTIKDSSFNQPYTVTIHPSGSRAYVTNSNSTTISIIDTANNSVIGVISGFDGPSGMAISADGTKAYVNNYGSPEGLGSGNGTTVSVVNLLTNAITATIPVGLAPSALAITPDGKHLYVTNYVDGNAGTGTVSVILTSNNSLAATLTGFFGPFGIAMTPDGKYAYVTNFGSNNFSPIGTTISIIKLKTNSLKKTITVGLQPSGIAISCNGRYAYVTNYNTLYADGENFSGLTAGQGTVNIIDVCDRDLLNVTIPVGQSPDNIALSHNGRYAYVSNYASNTISVIQLD